MITFYPRDIGLWRSKYDFSDRKTYPTKEFSSFDALKEYIKENFEVDDEEFPVRFIEEPNEYFGAQYMVYRWTVLGWAKESNNEQL